MMDSSREALKPDERGLGDAPGKSQGKLALALGVIAIALSLVLGFVYLISVRRLEREVARLSQETEGLGRLVVRAQEQSQTLAQQASQAAANAQAAAHSATWRSRINRTRRRRRNLRGSRPPPSSKRQIKPHSRLSNIGRSERRNLHSCNRLSGKSPKRVAPPWAW